MRRGAPYFIIVCVGVFVGCLSRPSLIKDSFTFATPAVSNVLAEAGPVVSINRILVAAPFDTQSLTYRTGKDSYERDPYAGFLVLPEESLAEPVRAYLRSTGYFRAVTEPGSSQSPDLELEISVPQLYGDFRDHSHPTAVLSVRFVAFKGGRGKAGQALFQKEYSRCIPLRSRTAAALMSGWNEALKEIVTQASSDLRSVLK